VDSRVCDSWVIAMQLERLVSAIVRQTTVLIARLSTRGGTRSPLAHLADQVFLGLVRELERQGVGKKVAADMFGLALRSYQLKCQRLTESASDTGVTLWSAIRAFIDDRGRATRAEIVKRFARDDPATVRGILSDLVTSGLVSRTGRGDGCVYRTAPGDDLAELARADSAEARAALVWLTVCREGPVSRDAVAGATGIAPADIDTILAGLEADLRVERGGDGRLVARKCLIAVGDAAGWEAALIDHHQAVLNALAAKVSSGAQTSAAADETGGSTYAFELWPGHPDEALVRGTLGRVRNDVARMWDRVSTHNARADRPIDGRYNVFFYMGQEVRQDEDDDNED
jgi:hypothetical protein